jgi:hypothetical protein
MKFGIREVCDMHFEKLSGKGPGSFTIESAKTSTLEGASTTVYAQGGKGNSRLMAWEGEKTLTFTVEDALITMESFYALTGADVSETTNGLKFTSKTTSFAGYYSIHADTLFRDEYGNDHSAYITIPRAKLQTNLTLTMAPSGDPSTFTFTFDAFPGVDENKDVLFTLEIYDEDTVTLEMPTELLETATVAIQGKEYTITLDDDSKKLNRDANDSNNVELKPVFAFVSNGVYQLKDDRTGTKVTPETITVTFAEGDTGITDLNNYIAKNTASSKLELTSAYTQLYVI